MATSQTSTDRGPNSTRLWPGLVAILAAVGIGCAAPHNIDYVPTEPIAPLEAPFEMPALERPSFPNRLFDIRDYGAIADGTTPNTQAFKDAIAACTSSGGGTVLIPPGLWSSGPIHLQSNVNLHIAQLYGDDAHHAYEAVFRGVAKALRMACDLDPRVKGVPSSKGVI